MDTDLNRSSEDESSADEQPPTTSQGARTPAKRIRQIPKTLHPSRFTNEIAKDKEIPMKHCAVCCRILYPEEYSELSKGYKLKIEELFVKERIAALAQGATVNEIEKMTWPLLNYRDLSGEPIRQLDFYLPRGKNKTEYAVVCPRHGSGGKQSLKTIMDYVS